MPDATGSAELENLFSKSDNVVGQAMGLGRWIQPPHQPLRLGRHARRAMPRMTPLRLDATHRKHRLPADIDHVATQGETQHGAVGKAQLPGTDEYHILMQPPLGKLPVDPAHADLEGQRDMIAENQGSSARAALSPINSYKIDPSIGRRHQMRKVPPERNLANGRLDPHRQAAFPGQLFDKIEHLVNTAEGRMRRGTVTILTKRNPADLGNLGADLGGRKESTKTRLGSLAELDLDRTNRPA